MPRKETSAKIGPKSGRIAPIALIQRQPSSQILRVYNTSSQVDCPVGIVSPSISVRPFCSLDITIDPTGSSVELGADTVAGTEPVEAIYERVPAEGLRSGIFKKPGPSGKLIIKMGSGGGVLYRFFNTHKKDAITVDIDSPTASSHSIKKRSSKDLFIGDGSQVTVGGNDIGIYDFLAFDNVNSAMDGSVRSGHFETAAIIVDLTGGTRDAVYRITNTGLRDISYTGTIADSAIVPESSHDVVILHGSKLTLSAGGGGSGPIQGSYELLRIN